MDRKIDVLEERIAHASVVVYVRFCRYLVRCLWLFGSRLCLLVSTYIHARAHTHTHAHTYIQAAGLKTVTQKALMAMSKEDVASQCEGMKGMPADFGKLVAKCPDGLADKLKLVKSACATLSKPTGDDDDSDGVDDGNAQICQLATAGVGVWFPLFCVTGQAGHHVFTRIRQTQL